MIVSLAIGAGAALLSTYPLILLARACGWQDAPGPADAERKLQPVAVPVVGGAAILLGLIALEVGDGTGLGDPFYVDPAFGLMFEGTAAWPPLLAAFFLGLVDDLLPGGLRPALKVAGQAGVGLVVALSVFPGEAVHLFLCLVFVPLVLNVWNTFDNADGAAIGVGAISLLSVGSPAAGPLLGFLGWNLRWRAGAAAYLGDSGSHLVGCLILLHPGAWPLMALPTMDLLRVSVLRVRRGQAPWRGDRRHLAHRLEEKGLPPLAVALCMWGVAAIPCVVPGWSGLGLTAIGFLALVWVTRPCPGTEGPR